MSGRRRTHPPLPPSYPQRAWIYVSGTTGRDILRRPKTAPVGAAICASMNIDLAFRQFLSETRSGAIRRRSEVTLANYECSFALLQRWFALRETTDLTEALLRQFFVRGETTRNWQPATTLSHRKALAPFFDWCVRRGFLERNPLDELPRPDLPMRLPEYYSDDEVEQLLYLVGARAVTSFEQRRNTAILAVLLLAGLRRGELLALRTTDVDFADRCLRVRAETAKNRAARVVPMNHRLESALREYWQTRALRGVEIRAFWLAANRPRALSPAGLKYILAKLRRSAAFPVKPHKMRHTFATKYYQGSKDVVGLKTLLGHKKLDTTMIYTHVLPDQTRSALESNPLNRLF